MRALQRLFGVARAGAYLSCALAVVSAFGIRAAKAEASRAALSIGRTLLPLVELETEKTSLRVNGQDLFVSSTVVDRSVGDVLDAFQNQCEAEAGPLAEAWRMPKTPVSKSGTDLLPRLDVFRREGGGEGVIFCFARGSQRSFSEAVAAFGKEGDIGAFGELRYAYAKPEENGRSRVLATWTAGSFRPSAVLPNGDAVGSDPIAAPRPPNAKRALSASLVDSPYAMYAYTSNDAPERVIAFYDEALRAQGWVTVRVPGDPAGRAYERDGAQIFVGATRPTSEASTHISLGEMGVSGADISRK